jgi:plasmid stabilization system protein ParE
MTRRLIIRPEAEADLAEASGWYEEQKPGLGTEFVAIVREALDRVLSVPRASRLMRRTPEVRRVFTRRFPYRVFYVLRNDAVVVFAVLHGARHDRHWQERL